MFLVIEVAAFLLNGTTEMTGRWRQHITRLAGCSPALTNRLSSLLSVRLDTTGELACSPLWQNIQAFHKSFFCSEHWVSNWLRFILVHTVRLCVVLLLELDLISMDCIEFDASVIEMLSDFCGGLMVRLSEEWFKNLLGFLQECYVLVVLFWSNLISFEQLL